MALALLRWSSISRALRSVSCLGSSTGGAWSSLQNAGAQSPQQQQKQQQQQQQQQQAREFAAATKAKAKGQQKKGKQKGKEVKKGPSKPKRIKSAGNFNTQDAFNARVLAMILPPAEPRKMQLGDAQLEEAAQRAKAYSRQKMVEHLQWQGRIMRAIRLRDAALAALPEDLRQAAQQEDLTPLPLSRNYYFDHPPKAYRG